MSWVLIGSPDQKLSYKWISIIKCFHWISFYFIFLRNNKKCFPLWHLICSFEKNLEIKKDIIHEKFKKKKNRKMLKKRHYLQQQIESHFWPRKRWNLVFSISIKVVENWILFQKTSILNQLEFLAASYGQNTKQVQKITQIQHHL